MSMSLTEIEKALIAIRLKVDVQNSKWTYTSLRIHVTETVGPSLDAMNKEMGDKEWELVAIVPNAYPDPGRSYEAFFKKRIQ